MERMVLGVYNLFERPIENSHRRKKLIRKWSCTTAPQYGFCLWLFSGQKVTCRREEPYNPVCEKWVKGTDTLLCEAFCLYEDRERFKPYEKHHSTVRDACVLAEQMKIPRLVLWHTEDANYSVRQEKYLAEGQQYYQGKLYVPYDLDILPLNE